MHLTGALNKRIGKFEEAQGGTLFLDEIADLDVNMQAKLLRVLQEREVVRIGGSEAIKLDVRLITATHKDLQEQVRLGEFREDLYYRILGLPIHLPPLRERGKDVWILSKFFINEFSKTNNTKPPLLTEIAKERLLKYNYPGNVRELKALIDLACVMCDGKEILPEDISLPGSKTINDFTSMEKTLHEHNWDIIQFYLRKYDNNVLTVAGKLGIGKSTIYNLLKQNEVRA